MMLRIGRSRGFILIEVMIATAVLALGSVMIHEAFLTSLDAFTYYSYYLDIAPWMEEKIWQVQDSLTHLGQEAIIDAGGELVKKNKSLNWSLSYELIDEAQYLYKIGLVVSWQEGQIKRNVLDTQYSILNTKKIRVYPH
ncbi:MAG: prepilin-type N-terminal cleavage/methylation domain-containing protein [Candidatus Omnitrophica bacterium]|nr:prepilin-type N-terminal cleavage/methylation domain-containing protein [Candidatus Omnitrophota bacterium]